MMKYFVSRSAGTGGLGPKVPSSRVNPIIFPNSNTGHDNIRFYDFFLDFYK